MQGEWEGHRRQSRVQGSSQGHHCPIRLIAPSTTTDCDTGHKSHEMAATVVIHTFLIIPSTNLIAPYPSQPHHMQHTTLMLICEMLKLLRLQHQKGGLGTGRELQLTAYRYS